MTSSAIDVPEASILVDGNFSTSDSLVDEDNSDEDDGDDNDAESEQFQENLTRNSALFQYFEKVQSDLSKAKYPPTYSLLISLDFFILCHTDIHALHVK